MEHLAQIQSFLKSNTNHFKEQEDAPGKRFFFLRNGEKCAYIWFKWALNGWRLAFYKEKEGEDWETRGPIESIEQLKKMLEI